MNLTTSDYVALGLPALGGLIWLIRLEATVRELQRQRTTDQASVDKQRISDREVLADQREADLRLLASERAADLKLNGERLDHINTALSSISRKLETLDGMRTKVEQIRSFIQGNHGQGV